MEPKIAKVENKSVKPKVYALYLKVPQGQFLWLEAAYSLENAFGQAKKLLGELHKDIDFNVAKIELFNHEAVDELFMRSTDIPVSHTNNGKVDEVSLVPTELEKFKKGTEKVVESAGTLVEEMMKRIVDGKNIKLYEESKPIFNKSQKLFLEDKLGIKKK